MEKIEYGPATFNVIRTVNCESTRIKDKQNSYLWTHWDFTVEVNFQPALGAYTRPPIIGNTVGPPVATPGTLPGVTDVALLNTILQPRQFLRVTAGGSVILQTPDTLRGVLLPCDCTGGPSCELVGVPLMVGIRHWVVQLHFLADVREPLANFGTLAQSVVVSNLWVSMEDIDFQRRSVRRFSGRAILRADLMRSQGVNANSFRDLYLFPCPDNYQRQNVSVQISEDGTVCEWSFEDAMRGYNLGSGSPIVSIEAFRTAYVSEGSPIKAIVDTFRSAFRLGSQGHPIDAVTGIPFSQIVSQLDNLPKYYIQCRVDLVGDRLASLGQLTTIALGICLAQLSVAGINADLTGTTETIFRQDIGDQVYTSVEMTRQMSDDIIVVSGLAVGLTNPLRTLLTVIGANNAALAAIAPGSAALLVNFQQNVTGLNSGLNSITDRAGGVRQNPPLRQGAYGVIPAPGNAIGTTPGQAGGVPTGSLPAGIVPLIVQALLGPNQVPARPGDLVNQS